jgi:aminomethyltransferase
LDKSGNILDDLIVYNMDNNFRIISNCATSAQNHEWFIKQSTKFDVGVCLNEDVSIIAVQGPESIKILNKIGYNDINNLSNFDIKFDASVMIAKTGYTGEEGFEIIVNNSEAVSFWEKLIDVGASPIGLGARDTLRLEAGLNLYGVDMDQTNNPYESNLSWTIDFNDSDRDFIGKKALSLIDKNTSKELKGVILKERGILRSGQVISHENGAGKILSGTFSPTLGYSIGMARLDKGHNNKGKVLIRNKEFNIEIISLPFIRKGKMRL